MKHIRILNILIILALASCIDNYPLPELKNNEQFLVVDAFLNVSNGWLDVKLSRTVNLQSGSNGLAEAGANVSIEYEFGPQTAYETSEGRYQTYVFVQPGNLYRLNIQLRSGKTYVSDWVEALTTSPIDSLTFSTNSLGLQVEVSTHGGESDNRHYMWRYMETWEYTSAFASDWTLLNGIAYFRNENIHNCWHVKPSSNILVYSTKSLEADVVSKFPIITIPKRDERLAIKYSILVQQLSVDQQAFEYWNLLKKNTENLGSLFDPQPSQLFGNLRCTSNDELVLGYFSASTVTEQRFTVSLFDLPADFRFARDFSGCVLNSLPVRDLGTLSENSYHLVTPVPAPGPTPTDFYYSTIPCTDCRLQGGTTDKPFYW